jgi:hypothetical protein
MHTFVKAWALHHNFWFGQAQPRFLYRYEDLVQNPIQITKALLQACGLWQMYSLDGICLALADMPPSHDNVHRLRNAPSGKHQSTTVLPAQTAALTDAAKERSFSLLP